MIQNGFAVSLAGIACNDIIDAALVILLLLAVWFDLRSRRIPNKLVITGLALSLGLHMFAIGDQFQLWGSGLLIGFGMLLPLYVLDAMGAGDIKLMAMVGAFLGPRSAFEAVLMTMLAGGVLSVAVALWNGALRRSLANLRFMVTHSIVKAMSGIGPRLEAPPTSTGNVPYAVAIALGTLIQIFLERSGHALVGH